MEMVKKVTDKDEAKTRVMEMRDEMMMTIMRYKIK